MRRGWVLHVDWSRSKVNDEADWQLYSAVPGSTDALVADPISVVVVGGGFAGINCAKALGNVRGVKVLLIDRRNHHLFQPLLYQVAMAGLSPADIAVPIRSLLSRYANVTVLQADVVGFDLAARKVVTDRGEHAFDRLLVASGARHAYFGHAEWEQFAPGLKTIEQATEIRRRVLSAFERAETEPDPDKRRAQLTFVVVGGGPTGVELAGAIGEMSRFTLAKDFRSIDPTLTRVTLIEAGPRILPSFDERLSRQATRDLERLGVQVWTNSKVTKVDERGVTVGDDLIASETVLWAAGVAASPLGKALGVPLDTRGRVVVERDLTIPGYRDVFVAGDLAACPTSETSGQTLPGVATVALQQGRYVARVISADLRAQERPTFTYWDKGQLATIGRSRAIMQTAHWRLTGILAWWVWLFVHIYYLSGFRNRLIVLFNWAWSYANFGRGARLIVGKDWRLS